MKLPFGLVLINIVDIEKRIRDIYIKGDKEAAYAAYRVLTGASIMESWEVVMKWVKIWQGKV